MEDKYLLGPWDKETRIRTVITVSDPSKTYQVAGLPEMISPDQMIVTKDDGLHVQKIGQSDTKLLIKGGKRATFVWFPEK